MTATKPDAYINDTAVVHETAKIGRGTKVWHFAVVHENAIIGEDCVISQGCYVGPGVVIGNGCRIQNNVSVYAGVQLQDNVFVGPSVVFTNCNFPRAYMKGELDKTLIKHGASIGANTTIVCGHVIGAYAFVAAGAVITKDVPDFAKVMGVPARITGYVERPS